MSEVLPLKWRKHLGGSRRNRAPLCSQVPSYLRLVVTRNRHGN